MRNRLAIVALAVALLVAALWFLVPRALNMPLSDQTSVVTILSSSGPVRVFVEVADDPLERSRGLMFRESLAEDAGMLFVFGDEKIRSFWMHSTLIPLDTMFIGNDLTIVDVVEGAVPCEASPCPLYTSSAPARYALEVNAGFVQDHGIEIADVVVFEE